MSKNTPLLPQDFLERMAEALKSLGHPQRLRIVETLDIRGETSVGDIAAACGGSQSQVSQHLNQMRRLGLVAARRSGTQVLYRLASEHPVTILNCMREKHGESSSAEPPARTPPKRRRYHAAS